MIRRSMSSSSFSVMYIYQPRWRQETEALEPKAPALVNLCRSRLIRSGNLHADPIHPSLTTETCTQGRQRQLIDSPSVGRSSL
jgi:hypothetical protein